MDPRAIQNDRDRIGPLKRTRLTSSLLDSENKFGWTNSASGDDDHLSIESSLSPNPSQLHDDKLLDYLIELEQRSNVLRTKQLDNNKSLEESIPLPSLLFELEKLPHDVNSDYKGEFPATMRDIKLWNIREMRIFLEWAKALDVYERCLNLQDKLCLLRSFAFAFNILNRVYYSRKKSQDTIVYPSGAFILRQPQENLRLSGFLSIYHRQMDEIMTPLRELKITTEEFAVYKATLFFNPDAENLSKEKRKDIDDERTKYLVLLFHLMTDKFGFELGLQRYGKLLLMSRSLQSIIDTNEENMTVMALFNEWSMDEFVKELCMRKDK